MYSAANFDDSLIVILAIVILILFILLIYNNIKKLHLKKDKQIKKVSYYCSVKSKREYINSEEEKFYYVTFLINNEEREIFLPKDKYIFINEGMNGELHLLHDKVFLDFIVK